MKVRPLLLFLVLSACCPAPLRQAAAFRAEVVGVSSAASALHLKSRDVPLLTLTITDGVLRSNTGQSLSLSSLSAGDRVYVQGTLSGSGLHATVVRRLE